MSERRNVEDEHLFSGVVWWPRCWRGGEGKIQFKGNGLCLNEGNDDTLMMMMVCCLPLEQRFVQAKSSFKMAIHKVRVGRGESMQ